MSYKPHQGIHERPQAGISGKYRRTGMSQLAAFSEKWEKQYPTAVHSWEENWGHTKYVFRLSCRDPKDHLYDKCDRRTKSTIQKSDEDKECIP